MTEKSADEIYTASGLGNLWVATYRVGQGSAPLQHGVVSLLYEDILPPEVKGDSEKLERSFDVARSIIYRIVNSPGHCKYTSLPQGSVDLNFSSDVSDVIRDTNRRTRPSPGALLEKILIRDALYMPDMGNAVPRTYGSGRGRYFSHAVRYILLQADTPHPAIDQLFAKLRPSFTALAGKEMTAQVPVPGQDYSEAIPKPFMLQDVVDAHLADNDDEEPIRAAFAELGIEEPVQAQLAL
ncbi:MAG TPA: hypothetical protein VHA05_01825 [Candidatus Saccharimonadales bacterium]|nr:hypothetical protein [Candidatus Saccharimonadales bacterium]